MEQQQTIGEKDETEWRDAIPATRENARWHYSSLPTSFCCTNLISQNGRCRKIPDQWRCYAPSDDPLRPTHFQFIALIYSPFCIHIKFIFIIHFAFIFYVCLTTSRCQWGCNRIGLRLQHIVLMSVQAHHPILSLFNKIMRMHFHSHMPIGIGIRQRHFRKSIAKSNLNNFQ